MKSSLICLLPLEMNLNQLLKYVLWDGLAELSSISVIIHSHRKLVAFRSDNGNNPRVPATFDRYETGS